MTGLTLLGQLLHEEHFRILVSICDLQNRVGSGAGEIAFDLDDEEEMQGLIGSLDRILAHDEFEENVIFPLIRAEGNLGFADLFAEEHVAIEPTTRRLHVLATEMFRHGPGRGCWTEFRRTAQQLFSQILEHLQNEEVAIVQQLHRWLDVDTDRRLARLHLSSRLQSAVAADSGLSR